jgi:cytochrome c oxidase subunit 2
MTPEFQFLPPQASTIASEVDALFFFLIGIALVFAGLICLAVIYFAVRYRRRSDDDAPEEIEGSLMLELTWTIIPLLICMVIFFWGTKIYFDAARPPATEDSIEILVTGKQWMWKLQHPDGTREINELHVPIGRPVTLTMTSEDVIHSFYIPAFRTKMDVVPGVFTSLWFEATQKGKFHLFCAEYCGTKHSEMIGSVHVMDPHEYANWLSGGVDGGSAVDEGKRLFSELGCKSCHSGDSGARGPNLEGLYGTEHGLESGGNVTVDAKYVRESILNPLARVYKGYNPVMPTYEGLVDEMGIMKLIAYIKSLESQEGAEGK